MKEKEREGDNCLYSRSCIAIDSYLLTIFIRPAYIITNLHYYYHYIISYYIITSLTQSY